MRVEGERFGRVETQGESLERTRGRGKSDVRSSSTPLHKDNKTTTSELSPLTHHKPPPRSAVSLKSSFPRPFEVMLRRGRSQESTLKKKKKYDGFYEEKTQ